MHGFRRQSGQSLVEYALVVALLFLAAVLAFSLLGGNLHELMDDVVLAFGGSVNYATDTFDAGLADWQVRKWAYFRGDWTVYNDRLLSERSAAIFKRDWTRTDYVIQIQSPQMVHEAPIWNGFGVFFRASDDTWPDGYLFEVERVRGRDRGVLVFSKLVRGHQIWPPLASVPVPAGFDWNNPGEIKLVVQGDEFTAYLADRPVLQASDSTFSRGGVGLAANWGSRLSVEGVSIDAIR